MIIIYLPRFAVLLKYKPSPECHDLTHKTDLDAYFHVKVEKKNLSWDSGWPRLRG